MTLTIHTHKTPSPEGSECDAIAAFLRWQGHRVVRVNDPFILKETRGRQQTVVKLKGETIATGYVELIELFESEGLFRI